MWVLVLLFLVLGFPRSSALEVLIFLSCCLDKLRIMTECSPCQSILECDMCLKYNCIVLIYLNFLIVTILPWLINPWIKCCALTSSWEGMDHGRFRRKKYVDQLTPCQISSICPTLLTAIYPHVGEPEFSGTHSRLCLEWVYKLSEKPQADYETQRLLSASICGNIVLSLHNMGCACSNFSYR